MSPIDDELRSALHSRTSDVTSSPDFFTGIEHKARRMKRNRAVGAVAGSALTVSALGLGGPLVASTLTGDRDQPAPQATSDTVEQGDPYALDPADPWAFRGDASVLEQGGREVSTREFAVRRGVGEDDVTWSPLYGQVHEPSGSTEIVYVATVDSTGAAYWGVVRSSESGPEFLVDVPLSDGTTALPAALPGDEVARLLVVADPDVGQAQYGPDAASEWSAMTEVEDGVSTTPLEGDADTDRVRVLDPAGEEVFEGPAPDVAEQSRAPEGEGPGTETPVEVDDAAYALDLSDPWAYRGPSELTQHPDLGSQDNRLFIENGTGRDDGSWSDRPLLAVEGADGLSVLVVLHRKGDEALVTTTWQRQDEAPRQSEQAVQDGQLLVQTFLPDAGPAGVLLAIASPRAGAVETDLVRTGQPGATKGVGIFELPADPPPGRVFLYSEGDGLLYHSEPARRS